MITKNYIKQCEGAEKIQKGWKPKIGDYIYLKKNEDTSIRESQIYLITDIVGVKISYINTFTGIDSWCYENRLKYYFTYLPTQEQLQEMMKYKLFEERKLLTDFPMTEDKHRALLNNCVDNDEAILHKREIKCPDNFTEKVMAKINKKGER